VVAADDCGFVCRTLKADIDDKDTAMEAPATQRHAQSIKFDVCLDCDDVYGYFEPLAGLVITGPTNTNVNDFRAILVL
jgi:hydroxypyruvate reductase